MNAPTITGFRLDVDDDRTLHYSTDDDMSVKLRNGGFDVGSGVLGSFVLIELDVDGCPSDVVTVGLAHGTHGPETLDRASDLLRAAREGLLS